MSKKAKLAALFLGLLGSPTEATESLKWLVSLSAKVRMMTGSWWHDVGFQTLPLLELLITMTLLTVTWATLGLALWLVVYPSLSERMLTELSNSYLTDMLSKQPDPNRVSQMADENLRSS